MSDGFRKNVGANRYEYHVGDRFAFANYRLQDKTLFIDYVEAPVELRGTGAAGTLMEVVMQEVKKDHLKVVPICGYAASWLRRHKEYAELMDS